MLHESIKHGTKGDVTRDNSQPRFLAQHSVAMLEQYCNIRNNVATMLQRCVARKIVVANRLMQHHLISQGRSSVPLKILLMN